ncbi:lipopolysaccharide biosynthesis protein [Dysgonomonas sp. BGC7]|uniref:lipopolysaccharide biosynthesis protein n=1 Tax=Dysgonomonas sp. BGC7 TaxID=1658008 RepID=UPI00067FB37A|nr:polysaccharide biosynthesis C-terminal domain-containing protein [Dysgonomonas sp. BGC7]MBD8390172.1 oligosaccharide flippase family protein [Dysgonomonas sp. BGC7]
MAGSGMKSLAKDTAIYGLSSIVGRFLNWCLFPLYISVFNPMEYGQVNRIYAYVAVLMVLLTYGMETGFFRFMNKKEENTATVYSTSLITLGFSSALFILLCFSFITPISELIKYEHKGHIMMMAMTVAIDAFMTIPFAYLRHQKRPMRFMMLRMTFVLSNIVLNVFFLLLCPWLYKTFPDLGLMKFYHPDFGVGYVFLANLLSTLIILLLLIPNTMEGLKFRFDNTLLKRILKYSFPLLILGLAGVVNQAIAGLVYPYLFGGDIVEADTQLGIYNASLKITVVITMFIQAFRYAYEPFFFGKSENKGNTKPYADAMKYFIIFALFIFLGMMFYIDVIKFLMTKVGKDFIGGLDILPYAMLGEIFFGIYFNLSVWYKLTDRTKYGAYFSVFGCVIQLTMNIILVPIYGYIASAWATFACNLLIMVISYFFGQKYFPIKYDLKSIFIYFALAVGFYAAAMLPQIDNEILRMLYRTVLLIVFAVIIVKRDMPLSSIPVINKYIKRKTINDNES